MGIESIHNNKNITIFAGNPDHSQKSGLSQKKENESQIENGSVYAGKLNMNLQNSISKRKEVAQKQALKIVNDQFSKEKALDDHIDSCRQHQSELSATAKAAQEEIEKLQHLNESLRESYSITPDSQEQKNLELIKKSMDSSQVLTDSEKIQLENAGPLTEYQKDVLKNDAMISIWQNRADQAMSARINESQGIEAVNLDRLKKAPMIKAREDAAEIIEAANKEAITALRNAAKDNVDKKLEENEEKAEEISEEHAAQKEPVQNTKEDKLHSEILQQSPTEQLHLDKELKEIVDANKILEEDLKGILVDHMY